MTRLFALTSILAAVACGGGRQRPERLSAAGNLAEADRHDRVAGEQQRLYEESRKAEGRPIQCYDQRLPGPSVGEPTRVLRPCWTQERWAAGDHLDAARAQRKEAARHRTVAASLLRAERAACQGLGEDEMSHSPFFHREDILRVEEVRVDGELHGARVLFSKVPGLDAPWMRRALACHQARAAAMGFSDQVMSYCPLMIAPTTVTVEDLGGVIAVTVMARRDWEIAAVVGRANDLLAPAPP